VALVVLLPAVALAGIGASTRPAAGEQLWASPYDGPANREDGAAAIAVAPDGAAVFVTGRSAGSGRGDDYATVAYDAATGAELWVARYDRAGLDDDAVAIGVDPDGSKVFVTGSSSRSEADSAYATIAYDAASGAGLWTARFDVPGYNDEPAALRVSPDGTKVFVTGTARVRGLFNFGDFETVAYDAATGGQLWARSYGLLPAGVSRAVALAVGPDGSEVFVTGDAEFEDFATVSYDSETGTPLWTRRWDGPAHGRDYAEALAVSPDGAKLFVTGLTPVLGRNQFQYGIVAYDTATGAELWSSFYDGPGSFDQPSAVGVSPDGSQVFVTGESFSRIDKATNYATVAYDTTAGAQLWARRYNGPRQGWEIPHALAVAPDSSQVFVTGLSDGPRNELHCATVAYGSRSGGELWVMRFHEWGNTCRAFDLGVSPDGSTLYVTGENDRAGGEFDYATIAYSTR